MPLEQSVTHVAWCDYIGCQFRRDFNSEGEAKARMLKHMKIHELQVGMMVSVPEYLPGASMSIGRESGMVSRIFDDMEEVVVALDRPDRHECSQCRLEHERPRTWRGKVGDVEREAAGE